MLIVGGGPAGLRAAELVSAAGLRTILTDQKPSVGRKFLVAGRGGLNLTHSEPVENFPARYGGGECAGKVSSRNFHQTTFAPGQRSRHRDLYRDQWPGFPGDKQAAPLLRRWIERLRKQGVSFRSRHALAGFRR